MSDAVFATLVDRELEGFFSFFEGVANEHLGEMDRAVIRAFLNWRASPKVSGVADGAPVRKGDTIVWREALYVVTAVFKSTVHLEGKHHSIKLRCLKPLAEGGFSEAVVVRRAGY